MAIPICTVDSLATGAACFANYRSNERYAIQIYYNAIELSLLGGPNYVAQMGSGGELESAAVCYMNLPLLEANPPTAYDLLIAYNNAVNVGGAPAAAGSTALAEAIQCNKNFSPAQHAAQLLFLQCSLGSHADYPQPT